MKTEVLMKRDFLWWVVHQKSKSWYFNISDLVMLWNIIRLSGGRAIFSFQEYKRQKSNIEFIKELKKQFWEVIQSGRWRNSITRVHPLLFIDVALQISPTLKVQTYKWMYDNLLKFRNDSWDSYKKMAWSLFVRLKNKRKFQGFITNTANEIKLKCWVKDRETANETQLEQREKIHNNITLLAWVLTDPQRAVKLGIEKTDV